jgi:hypothetical protein
VVHYAGERDETEMHLRESPFAAFFTRGATLVGLATLDNGRDFRRGLRLLGRDVDASALTNPATDLRKLATMAG